MKTSALKRFRRKLKANEPVFGLWLTLNAPSITEMGVSLDVDWVTIDAEHGQLDWKDILEHLRATVRSETVALVRLAQRDTGLIKRALDLGADGVIIPWMESAEQLRETVADCTYPPKGRRGIGGERATVWNQSLAEHTSEADDNVLIVPIIETVTGGKALPEMLKVPGVDVFFFGPADFSSSAGFKGQWEGPGIAEEILRLKDLIRAAGKHCGVMSTSPADLQKRVANGFQMLGLGNDAGFLFRSLHESLKAVGRDRTPSASLDPRDSRPSVSPLPKPPESMRADRREVITTLGQAKTVELQKGVTLQPLVGKFNEARNLTTGIVTFSPNSVLDCHTHPCSESITVLEGELEAFVDGRVYRLSPLDNITIPRWLPHSSRNRNSKSPVRVHVALASDTPERDLVTRSFVETAMPDDSTGVPGRERVTRFNTAKRTFGVGPGAEFIDYFNAELVPGIEMSGGFGRFQIGGRLPAHVHDFDESICIIDGTATCLVEGNRHSMGDCATAMVPRGRVHYFINESKQSMDMIWVYAGPMPERIVIEESYATGAHPPSPPK